MIFHATPGPLPLAPLDLHPVMIPQHHLQILPLPLDFVISFRTCCRHPSLLRLMSFAASSRIYHPFQSLSLPSRPCCYFQSFVIFSRARRGFRSLLPPQDLAASSRPCLLLHP